MAKLVAVCRDEEFPFERRQIPLTIEETLTMVMEIPETIITIESVNSADTINFTKRYDCLSHVELHEALLVCQKELFALLAVLVPCVGCRRSVERLYNQLWESCQPAIEPLIINEAGVLSISDSFLLDSKLIYALFYVHGSHLNEVVDNTAKSKRNRRCILHSLESHKARASGSWMDVWDLLSQECRDEVVLIDSDSLHDTLESYLRKHRFCSECKSKVLRAYSILAGDVDGDAEKGYCAALYEGLKSCPKDRHIHVVCDTDFIAHLIGRAEPELAGGRRERHARTIDIAQEEVLTCLGIHLWERLHRLWQKLRAEEKTWQMLFYLGIEALRKRFETAIEEKQGITQLELVVEEISEAERVKEKRKETKRLKRRKRKENKAKLNVVVKISLDNENYEEEEEEEKKENIEDDEKSSVSTEHGSEIDERKVESKSQGDNQKKTVNEPLASPSSQISSSDNSLCSCDSNGSSQCDCKVSEVKNCEMENDNNNQPEFKNGLLLKEFHCPRKSSSTKKCPSKSIECLSASSSCSNNSTNVIEAPFKYIPCKSNLYNNKDYKNDLNNCECDKDYSKHDKRNGYSHAFQYQKSNFKRNGCSTYDTSYQNIGPRFKKLNHYSDENCKVSSPEQGNIYGKGYSNAQTMQNGRGRGKRKGNKNFKDQFETSKWNNLHANVENHQKFSTDTYERKLNGTRPTDQVEDEDELRLLKIMGWNSDDSFGISEQEIKEFSENLCDVQTQREQLRNNIREQFNKLTVNGLFCNC